MTEIRSATGFLSATSNFQLGFEKLDMMLVEANRGDVMTPCLKGIYVHISHRAQKQPRVK